MKKDKADISISALDNGQIEYRIENTLITGYGLSRLCKTTKPKHDEIHSVIQSVSHFFWHLRRCPKKNTLRDKFRVEFTRLERTDDVDDNLLDIRKPVGGNLIKNGLIDIEADKKTEYGLTIRNNIETPLHVSVFYFDCSDLSIEKYYLPPAMGENAAPSLPCCGQGMLPIGYGDGGGDPKKFFLREGQELDIGFLKLFVSTEPVDLEGIQQPSAFDPGRGTYSEKSRPQPLWDTHNRGCTKTTGLQNHDFCSAGDKCRARTSTQVTSVAQACIAHQVGRTDARHIRIKRGYIK